MAELSASRTRTLRFGPFELHVRAGELRKHGIRIKLREQPVQILLLLLDRPGEVVLREEIRQQLWPNNTVVEFDHGINAAIQKLRDALGESAGNPRYVETVARRGYRFLGEVEKVGEPNAEPSPPPVAEPAPPAADNGTHAGDLTNQTISHYRILNKLGAGGMGVVYRAEDLTLGRRVALKFLPPAVDGLPASATQRFEREARAASALNHPHICTVYGFERFDDRPAIVMELLEGDTLAARLAKGPLTLQQSMAWALQILSALAEAHGKRVVHRDLKPANIMLVKSGVKVLDFGLAKIDLPVAAEDLTASITRDGTVMGSLHYMSPEQAQGREADARSDIFSFGVVFYEMLTGRRVFEGGNPAAVTAALLERETPSVSDLAPAALDRILSRCLSKDPDERWQSARDLEFAFAAMGHLATAGPNPPAKSPFRPGQRVLTLSAVGLVALGLVAGWLLRPPQTSVQWSGSPVGGPEMTLNPRLSPDGHLLAFQVMDRGLTQVAVLKPESGSWLMLTHRRDCGPVVQLSWSPDGGSIYYDRWMGTPNGVYSVPVLGGDERLVLENARAPEALPDGTLLLARLNPQRQTQVFRFWPETGRLKDLPLEIGFTSVYASGFRAVPGGRQAIAFASALGGGRQDVGLFAVDLASNGVQRLSPTPQQTARIRGWAITHDGTAVLAGVPAASIWRVVTIPIRGPASEHTLFTSANGGVWYLESGADGSVYANLADHASEVVRLSPMGELMERIGSYRPVSGGLAQTLMLPDGRAVVQTVSSNHGRLIVMGRGKDGVPLVNTSEETADPVALVGQREIAFVIGPPPHQTIAVAEIANGRITRRIAPGKGPIQSITSSPDGSILYFGAADSIWKIPVAGGEAAMICAGRTAVIERSGRSLVVTRIENSRLAMIHVFLDGTPERRIPLDEANPPDTGHAGGISFGSLDSQGRLLMPLSLADSWFNPLSLIDTASGRITRLTTDNASDYYSAVWTPDGNIVAGHTMIRAAIWKFQPESR